MHNSITKKNYRQTSNQNKYPNKKFEMSGNETFGWYQYLCKIIGKNWKYQPPNKNNKNMRSLNGSLRTIIHAMHAAFTLAGPKWALFYHQNCINGTLFFANSTCITFNICHKGFCQCKPPIKIIGQWNWGDKQIKGERN